MMIWKRLFGRGCSHKFSWPRVDTDGRHYQICLVCGTAYEYDWTMMRRTSRLMEMSSTAALLAVSANQHQFQTSPLEIPITRARRS
jgi:hypothetical protein